ncbi:L,D-transpeptidase family protein [Streptomyces sp. NPDC048275]|uniref:L,D-transpeptidase family protein n=1 Tax=Streptomyces sp. NPDC048275 TaxID=3155629 RepID=UPI0033FDFEC9
MRRGLVTAACAVLAVLLSACGGPEGRNEVVKGRGGAGSKAAITPAPAVERPRIPGIGDRMQARIPSRSRQVLAVYGDGKDSADSMAVLYVKSGSTWVERAKWPAHNGKRGWTTDHQEDDLRSPVGVFTLSDSGGLLDDPGTRFPYDQSESYQSPYYWDESHWHDFDYVIAINYNRREGTPPDDPIRPLGQSKGGGIWLHVDHGSGTLACVSVSREAMEYLLQTLDPDQHPVMVMGDRENLKA